jgi:hypothetical protein
VTLSRVQEGEHQGKRGQLQRLNADTGKWLLRLSDDSEVSRRVTEYQEPCWLCSHYYTCTSSVKPVAVLRFLLPRNIFSQESKGAVTATEYRFVSREISSSPELNFAGFEPIMTSCAVCMHTRAMCFVTNAALVLG